MIKVKGPSMLDEIIKEAERHADSSQGITLNEDGDRPILENKDGRQWYENYMEIVEKHIQKWQEEGRPSKQIAEDGFALRHHARMVARDMTHPKIREFVEARDLQKYGHKDGPTFDSLLKQNHKLATDSGLSGDAANDSAYRAIIQSCSKPNQEVSQLVGAAPRSRL